MQAKNWLSYINSGLAQNEVVQPRDILAWVKELLTSTVETKSAPLVQSNKPVSTYEIVVPVKAGVVRDGSVTSSILLHEFALQCLYNLLMNGKVAVRTGEMF